MVLLSQPAMMRVKEINQAEALPCGSFPEDVRPPGRWSRFWSREERRFGGALAAGSATVTAPNRSSCAGTGGGTAGGAPACGLDLLAECYQPLLFDIMEWLVETPLDLTTFSCELSVTLATQCRPNVSWLWNRLYAQRWPSFHDGFNYTGVQDWRSLYQQTLHGQCVCTLEIFVREKKAGFAMSAMAAEVQYDQGQDCYVANYLSASEVQPEFIPVHEDFRLRFCPSSARSRLQPGLCLGAKDSLSELLANDRAARGEYPYRVLEGTQGLVEGSGVELQWKMQYGSPFGWWYGCLESLKHHESGTVATATITFRHFPSNSRWYRLQVCFGDSEMRTCSFGGFTGGLRSAMEAEHEEWMRFFPSELVVF